MSLDALFINPGGRETIYQGLGAELTAVEPPLWCRLLAGYVLDRGHTADILDAEALGLDAHAVATEVEAASPRLVVLAVYGHQPSASTQQMAPALEAARAIRERLPKIPVAILGGHVAALPERTLIEAPHIDFACNSEGPETVNQLLLCLKAGAQRFGLVEGLVWRDEDGICVNPAPPLIADLSALHGRTWDLLPMDKYRAHNWQCFDGSPRQPYASIFTSLGCPYGCSFCMINSIFDAATKGRHRYRMRAPSDVVAEIAMLHDSHGVRTFKIVDEMFVLNPKHYGAICEGLAALPYAGELNIWAYARIDTVRSDSLALLRRAGVRWLALGIESGSSYVRDGAEKEMDDGDIVATVRAIQAAGINVIGNYIFGLPGDDHASMQATLELAMGLQTEFANFYSAMAYPGSRLFDSADVVDLPDRWSGYSQHSRDTKPYRTEALSAAEILAFRDEAFGQYFGSARYLRMVGEKFGPKAVAEIDAMLATDIERDLLAA